MKTKYDSEFIETYVRPWYKSVALYLLIFIVSSIIYGIMNYILCGILSGNFNKIAKDTIFGDIPYWCVIWFAMITLNPICCIPLFFALVPRKYEREWKQKLIPFNYKKQIMEYPEKINGHEPIWKPNYTFTATLKFVSIDNYNHYSFAKLSDESNTYLMFSSRFNELAKEADVMHNTYYGTFTFDTDYRIVNIKEV